MRVSKIIDDPTIAERWTLMPKQYEISLEMRKDINAYAMISYPFIRGHYPRNVGDVWRAASSQLWRTYLGFKDKESFDPSHYVHYMDHAVLTDKQKNESWWMDVKWMILDYTGYTPVHFCHGDMTLENVIHDRGTHKFYFIDPGNPRGLPCRELDEAKLLQSVSGFDHFISGHDVVSRLDLGFVPKKIHYALLITHLLRLMRHQPEHVKVAAVRKIEELVELWL